MNIYKSDGRCGEQWKWESVRDSRQLLSPRARRGWTGTDESDATTAKRMVRSACKGGDAKGSAPIQRMGESVELESADRVSKFGNGPRR